MSLDCPAPPGSILVSSFGCWICFDVPWKNVLVDQRVVCLGSWRSTHKKKMERGDILMYLSLQKTIHNHCLVAPRVLLVSKSNYTPETCSLLSLNVVKETETVSCPAIVPRHVSYTTKRHPRTFQTMMAIEMLEVGAKFACRDCFNSRILAIYILHHRKEKKPLFAWKGWESHKR